MNEVLKLNNTGEVCSANEQKWRTERWRWLKIKIHLEDFQYLTTNSRYTVWTQMYKECSHFDGKIYLQHIWLFKFDIIIVDNNLQI